MIPIDARQRKRAYTTDDMEAKAAKVGASAPTDARRVRFADAPHESTHDRERVEHRDRALRYLQLAGTHAVDEYRRCHVGDDGGAAAAASTSNGSARSRARVVQFANFTTIHNIMTAYAAETTEKQAEAHARAMSLALHTIAWASLLAVLYARMSALHAEFADAHAAGGERATDVALRMGRMSPEVASRDAANLRDMNDEWTRLTSHLHSCVRRTHQFGTSVYACVPRALDILNVGLFAVANHAEVMNMEQYTRDRMYLPSVGLVTDDRQRHYIDGAYLHSCFDAWAYECARTRAHHRGMFHRLDWSVAAASSDVATALDASYADMHAHATRMMAREIEARSREMHAWLRDDVYAHRPDVKCMVHALLFRAPIEWSEYIDLYEVSLTHALAEAAKWSPAEAAIASTTANVWNAVRGIDVPPQVEPTQASAAAAAASSAPPPAILPPFSFSRTKEEEEEEEEDHTDTAYVFATIALPSTLDACQRALCARASLEFARESACFLDEWSWRDAFLDSWKRAFLADSLATTTTTTTTPRTSNHATATATQRLEFLLGFAAPAAPADAAPAQRGMVFECARRATQTTRWTDVYAEDTEAIHNSIVQMCVLYVQLYRVRTYVAWRARHDAIMRLVRLTRARTRAYADNNGDAEADVDADADADSMRFVASRMAEYAAFDRAIRIEMRDAEFDADLEACFAIDWREAAASRSAHLVAVEVTLARSLQDEYAACQRLQRKRLIRCMRRACAEQLRSGIDGGGGGGGVTHDLRARVRAWERDMYATARECLHRVDVYRMMRISRASLMHAYGEVALALARPRPAGPIDALFTLCVERIASACIRALTRSCKSARHARAFEGSLTHDACGASHAMRTAFAATFDTFRARLQATTHALRTDVQLAHADAILAQQKPLLDALARSPHAEASHALHFYARAREYAQFWCASIWASYFAS
jgi:hypothetical protein